MIDALSTHTPVIESVLRALLGYLAIIILIRLIPKRQIGDASPQDLIGAIMIGGLAVEGIVPDEASPIDALIMITMVLLCNFALAWLSDRFPGLRWFISEPPTCLIRGGKPLKRALQKEMLTMDELLVELRKQGIKDLAQVHEAFMEADGSVSVVKFERRQDSG